MKKTKAPPVVDATISVPNHLRLGEYHPAFGGAFLGLMRGEPGQPDCYLFKATGDGAETEAAFGNYGQRVNGADHDRDGRANTQALIAPGADHPAAQWARKITRDGFSDFYLPAREELRLARANAPELFQKDASYWSSTQCRGNDDYAWVQGFDEDGTQWSRSKSNARRVCAVRRLLVI